MASISRNHDNYQVRLNFVQTVLQERFGFKENPKVTPIQYDPECPFKYNNFVYRVSLLSLSKWSEMVINSPAVSPFPIVPSTAMTSVGAGPWLNYEASFKSRLEVAIRKSDANPYIKGWRANDVRERLDSFIERGLPAQFEDLDSQQDRVIIHVEFTTNNILFDATSNRITALIDYDFACISHPSYEFLRSYDGAGGQSRGRPGTKPMIPWLCEMQNSTDFLHRFRP
ncbi:hypothetical protein V490_02512 [Pseudogymnoascus sp. VKM F-3557]|nr:hypothetical protein V490_02512 [Pseudogymnoascus sp. VKM F-3557]